MKGLIDTIQKLGMARVAMLVGVTLGLLGAFVWLEFQGPGRSRVGVLAADLDQPALRQLITELTNRKIQFRQEGNQILVADSDMTAARNLLTASGFGQEGITGYEIFDRGTDFAVTEFDQQVKLTRALEGELARTIVSVRGISHARVHLVLPRREPFAHERQRAQASVMLKLAGRGTLSDEAVQSVVNLVAASVPGLRPQDITVVDSNLHLLVRAGDGKDPGAQSQTEDELRRKTESRLAQAVELMLERSLGPGHVHAEAAIRMNFDRVNETQEKYDPDGSVVRSTQSVTSNNKTTDKSGSVSVQNNLPNADAGAAVTGSQEGRQEETTNYEIGKTVRAIVHDQPMVERITLAVMVDGVMEPGADGKPSWKARDQAELERIEKLVRSAAGLDEKRGDRLDVVSMPFVSAMEVADTAPAPRPAQGNGDLITLIQMIAFGTVGFGIIILTARSILAALNKPPAMIAVPDGSAGGGAIGTTPGANALAIETGSDDLGPMDDEETVTMNQIHGQLRASSLRKVAQLVEQHPDTTLGIIRAWIAADGT